MRVNNTKKQLIFIIVIFFSFSCCCTLNVLASTDNITKISNNNIKGTLGFGPNEFQSRFNKFANKSGVNLKISRLKIERGAQQDVFNYLFTDGLGLVGVINKADGNLRSVVMIGQVDGTSESSFKILMCIGTIIAAVNPELNNDDRGSILNSLGLFSKNLDINTIDGKTVRNGKRYIVSGSENIGIMFGVEDASDN